MSVLNASIALTLMVTVLPANAQTIDGFRGYKWGADYESMRAKFSLEDTVEEMNDLVIYDSNVRTLGGIHLKGCSFVFYKGMFSGVVIYTPNHASSRALLRLWTEAYGEAYKPNDFIEEYYWDKIGDDSYATYDQNYATNEASLIYGCLSLMQKREQDEQDAARKGVSDL